MGKSEDLDESLTWQFKFYEILDFMKSWALVIDSILLHKMTLFVTGFKYESEFEKVGIFCLRIF